MAKSSHQNILPIAMSSKVPRQTIKDPREFFKSRSNWE